ncbi:MAG: hypothetical protein GOV00_02180 [Candidatus Altiarchaeota archaeon]|nr:hypothetical protein [Candidatus Altiarchaeota archaeon]
MIDDRSLYEEQSMFDFLETGVPERGWKENMIMAELSDAGRTYYEFNAEVPLELEKNSPEAFGYGMRRMLLVDAMMSMFFAEMDEPTVLVLNNPEKKGIFGRVRRGRKITYAEIWTEVEDGDISLDIYDLAGNHTKTTNIDEVIYIVSQAQDFSEQASNKYLSSLKGVLEFFRSGRGEFKDDLMNLVKYPKDFI